MGVDTGVSVGDGRTVGGTWLAGKFLLGGHVGQCPPVRGLVVIPLAGLEFWPFRIVGTDLAEVADGESGDVSVVVGLRVAVQQSRSLEAVWTGHVHGAQNTESGAGVGRSLAEATSSSVALVLGGDSVEQFAHFGGAVETALPEGNGGEVALVGHFTGLLVEEGFNTTSLVTMGFSLPTWVGVETALWV